MLSPVQTAGESIPLVAIIARGGVPCQGFKALSRVPSGRFEGVDVAYEDVMCAQVHAHVLELMDIRYPKGIAL